MSKKQTKIVILIVVSSVFFSLHALSQKAAPLIPSDIYKYLESMDPTLINGKQYTYFAPKSMGSPFFSTSEFTSGRITIRGRTFEKQELRYDIYNQQVTLRFVDAIGANRILVIPIEWLESFNIGSFYFEVHKGAKDELQIYQVIGAGAVKCLYHRKCFMALESNLGQSKYVFTEQQREAYLQKDGRLYLYGSNKSFAKFFGDQHYDTVRKYLRSHKVKVAKANDSTMLELINYCNSL